MQPTYNRDWAHQPTFKPDRAHILSGEHNLDLRYSHKHHIHKDSYKLHKTNSFKLHINMLKQYSILAQATYKHAQTRFKHCWWISSKWTLNMKLFPDSLRVLHYSPGVGRIEGWRFVEALGVPYPNWRIIVNSQSAIVTSQHSEWFISPPQCQQIQTTHKHTHWTSNNVHQSAPYPDLARSSIQNHWEFCNNQKFLEGWLLRVDALRYVLDVRPTRRNPVAPPRLKFGPVECFEARRCVGKRKRGRERGRRGGREGGGAFQMKSRIQCEGTPPEGSGLIDGVDWAVIING